MGDPVYCDTSALAKLVLREPETDAFAQFASREGVQMASSEIAHVELLRAASRVGPAEVDRAHEVLALTVLLPLTTEMRLRAADLSPSGLRSLDAIHLATALEILPSLTHLVTYDARLAEAGGRYGLNVIAPGIGSPHD